MINENKPTITSYNSPDEVPEELDPNAKETFKNMVRQNRNQLLKDTDKYFLIDYPINYDQQMIIKQYRQKLRDMPETDFIIPDSPDFIK